MSAPSNPPVPEGARVLVILNERVPRHAIDWYRALERLQAEERIEAWSVYPFLARRAAGVGVSSMMREIGAEADELRATVVLWAHFVGVSVPEGVLRSIGGARPRAVHGYWEGDWYDRWRKPFPRETAILCATCDSVFLPGDGHLVRLLRDHGCRDIRFVPSTGDDRFHAQPRRETYDFDVVMIGSRITSRVPFRDLPGNVLRRRLVGALQRRHGSRFAVFGSGWRGPSALGPVPFDQQAEAYGRSCAIVGNNNMFARYCYSNRLPIAMLSGRPLVYGRFDGCEEVFAEDSGVHWFESVDDALRRTDAVVADPEAAFVDAEKARLLAEDRFTTYHALRYMISVLSAKRRTHDGVEEFVANPWIDRERL